MLMRLRSLLPLLVALLAAGLVAGCGGGATTASEADSSTDVDQLLKDTFSGKQGRSSPARSTSRSTSTPGGERRVRGQGRGPFESQGEGKLPKLDIDASLEGGGQNLEAGVTSTGDKGFVSYGGTEYEVPARSSSSSRPATSSRPAGQGQNEDQSLASARDRPDASG